MESHQFLVSNCIVVSIMRSFGVLFTLWALLSLSAALNPRVMGETDRLITLERSIQEGKSVHDATERNLQSFHSAFHSAYEKFQSFYDALICSAPDKLKEIYEEMEKLIKKTDTSHKLKKDQLDELKNILHHENYTDTGLSTGNDALEDACKGLDEYIKKANETTTDEEEEIKEHIKEVEDAKEKMDSHPCPCVWGPWSDWTECSKTCEAGSRQRERQIEQEAINNGTVCEGDELEEEVCNDVCCPVDCKWGEWELWGDCPSGCDQEKTRVRQMMVEASCNGIECDGNDYEKQICSREEELAEQIRALLDENETLEKNQCQVGSEDGKWMMCDGVKCIPCTDDPKCAETSIGDLAADKDKLDLKSCPHGYGVAGYKEFSRNWPLPSQFLKVCVNKN